MGHILTSSAFLAQDLQWNWKKLSTYIINNCIEYGMPFNYILYILFVAK